MFKARIIKYGTLCMRCDACCIQEGEIVNIKEKDFNPNNPGYRVYIHRGNCVAIADIETIELLI